MPTEGWAKNREATLERRNFLRKAAFAGAGAGAATLAAPALAQGTKELTIVSTWPRDFPGLGISAQRLAQRITDLSEGRLTTQYFAAGERVGAFDSFDEVASGNSQAYIAADYYWRGKHPGWAYFTAVPFGMTAPEIDAWMKYRGGQELMDKVGAEFGIKGLPCGNTGVQMGGWFNKEMESADDFKGLKMRIPGLGGDVLTKLGASTVSLPGGQIYENLVSGSIDATEWVGPWNDYFLKFYEAAKYYYYPGMHEPGSQLTFGMNADFVVRQPHVRLGKDGHRSGLPRRDGKPDGRDQRQQRRIPCQALINEQGVELREFNDDIYESFGEAAQEVFEETRDHSALAAEINDNFQAALREIGGWMALADISYSNKRNAVLGIES